MRQYTFFYGRNHPFSNFYPCQFSDENRQYNCMEQYFQYHKALHFGDANTAHRIMQTRSPYEQKRLGRLTSNYNDRLWKEVAYDIMMRGAQLKFQQNRKLQHKLIATHDTLLVEASPYDRYWGIGLSHRDPRIYIRGLWRGLNMLGKILTNLRNDEINKLLENPPGN